MPLFTTMIESTSPLLKISQQWLDGASADIALANYSESSFVLTQTLGAVLSVEFNGTGVTVVGAKRPNHGTYSVSLDGVNFPIMDGYSDVNTFNVTLYANDTISQNVPPQPHTLMLTNQENAFFDVDYVLITTEIGNPTETLIVNTIQDTHPYFTYTPSSSWSNPQNFVGSFMGASGHATLDPSASMVLSFEGMLSNASLSDGVAIYGPVGPNQTASYLVQADGGEMQQFSAYRQFYRSRQVLYYATGLGGGSHNVSMRLSGMDQAELAIDFANIYSTPSLGGSFLEPGILETAPTDNGHGENGITHSVIATFVILGVLSVIFSSLSAYLFRRRPRKQESLPYIDPFDIDYIMKT